MDKPAQVKRLWGEMLASMRKEGALATPGVEAAFSAVPRHLFLPHLPVEEVYADRAIGIQHDEHGLLTSSSSQPTMMAIMLNQLQLKSGDNVLEIGTATGYNAAIMKHIVGDDGTITSIEIDADLARQAKENLQRNQIKDVHVVHADGALGYAPRASYNHILATVGVWDIPAAWINQLKPNGSLVVPIVIDGIQVSATFILQTDGTALSVDNRPCSFVYLRGQHAGPNFRRQVGSSSLFILADQVDEIDTAGLHSLLSDDQEYCQLAPKIKLNEFWFGYQLYLMLNEPEDYIFLVYAVANGQQAYGLEGRGVGLFARGSAGFAEYNDKGLVHCFAGSDTFMEMQNLLDEWIALNKPSTETMRLRLIPKDRPKPTIEIGKLYERRDHYLHVWLEV